MFQPSAEQEARLQAMVDKGHFASREEALSWLEAEVDALVREAERDIEPRDESFLQGLDQALAESKRGEGKAIASIESFLDVVTQQSAVGK
ncbi:MAG: hypothetical protein KDB07_11880 [Planctomycetes bacterium]|nr:hypothetical protein [Planctomycetota bacterium]